MWAAAWQDVPKTRVLARNKQGDSTLDYLWKVLFWIIAFRGFRFPIIQQPQPVVPSWEDLKGRKGEERGEIKPWWVQLVLSLVGLTDQKKTKKEACNVSPPSASRPPAQTGPATAGQ